MIPNNNFSVIPWYTSRDEQNARSWWRYGRIYPLYVTRRGLVPFQIIIPHRSTFELSGGFVYDARTDTVTYPIGIVNFFRRQMYRYQEYADSMGIDILVFSIPSEDLQMREGQYYIELTINGVEYFSEVFTVVGDLTPFLQIEWKDETDFVMDGGAICYEVRDFTNRLYLPADLAKPEYIFEEEGETRDGYFFPLKQISEKRYRFSFLASEYLLDVMRFIRLSDWVRITYHEQQWMADSFLITPEWEAEGDVASVIAEFDTATVAKKIGKAFGIT